MTDSSMSEIDRLSTLSEVGIQNLRSNNELTGNNKQQPIIDTQTTINQQSSRSYNLMDSNIHNSSISPELDTISLSQAQNDGSPDSKSEGKYHCAVCNNSFSRKQNLKAHLVTHTEKKPYLCGHCGFSFRRPYDLRRHERIHTDEKPFTCVVCNKTFPRKDALNRHTKSSKGCHLKGRSFSEGKSIRDHQKKKAIKNRDIQVSFDNHDESDTNNENNFFLQEALQESRRFGENEPKFKGPESLDIPDTDSNNGSPQMELAKLNPIPLKTIFANILAETMSSKSELDSFSDAIEGKMPLQLSEAQMQVLKLIMEKLHNLDTRVTVIEQLLRERINYLPN